MATLDINIRQANADFQAIKNSITETGIEVAEGTKTSEYATKVGEVYEAGKNAEYNTFWDIYQKNGTRTNYDNAFGGQGWTPETLKPKYDIRPTSGYMMFRAMSFVRDDYYADIAKHFEDLGIVLDTSNCTNLQYAFQWFFASRFGKIDLSNCTSASSIFAYSTIYEMDEIVFSERTHIDGMFTGCGELEKVKFSGVLTKSLDMGDCKKLNKASIESIFNIISQEVSNLSLTLSEEAVNKAFEESPGANNGVSSIEFWLLCETRPGVSVSCI